MQGGIYSIQFPSE